jgi:hypothetical protein
VDLIGTENIAHHPAGLHETGAEDTTLRELEGFTDGRNRQNSPDWMEEAEDAQEAGEDTQEAAQVEQETFNDEEQVPTLNDYLNTNLDDILATQGPSTPIEPVTSLYLATPTTPTPMGPPPMSSAPPKTLTAAIGRAERKQKALGVSDVMRESSAEKLRFKREVFERDLEFQRETLEVSRKRAEVEEDCMRLDEVTAKYSAWSTALAGMLKSGVSVAEAIVLIGERPALF